MSIEQRRVENLQAKSDLARQQQTAFKGIEARLLNLQNNLFQLGRSQNTLFDLRTASSSDDTLLTAAAGSSARPGVYQVKVSSLAQSHQVASQGFDGPSTLITQGTLQIGTSLGTSATLTIDGTNNTLQGLANAINSSGTGVSALIVQDGSPSHRQPYRLLLTSGKTGAANAVTITNNLAADAGGATRPVLDQAFTGPANLDPGFTGTSVPTANSGGTFTGTSNNLYTFTVVSGGTVGTDNNLQIAYADATGARTGTLTLNAADLDTYQTVAEGIEVKFSAGTLTAGQTFTVKGFVPTVQEARDAALTLGSGLGALTVQSATNQVDGLFPGVTLALKGADAAKTLTLTISNDVQKARQGIVDFVTGFNDLMQFIDEQVDFEAETSQAGTLLGNRQATGIQDQVRDMVLGTIPGLKPQMNRLGAIGITANDKGQLSLNQTKLDDVFAGRVAGVGLDDVRRLFAFTGSSPQAGIEFITGSQKTKATGSPFQVVVTQAARQASIQATNPLAASTLLDGTNNTLTLQIDGTPSSTITLATGTYSRLGLVQELQAKINTNPGLLGRGVTVGLNGDNLVVTSNAYGSTSRVSLGSGTALPLLGFSGTENDTGQDVAGNFVVDGQVETATGQGQVLLGSIGNATTADLQVRVSLTASQVGAGLTTDMTLTRGVASITDLGLANLLDPVTGRLKTVKDGFQERIDDIQETITRQNRLATQRRDRLLRQFVSLETTVNQLQNLGNFLTTQMAQINGLSAQNR